LDQKVNRVNRETQALLDLLAVEVYQDFLDHLENKVFQVLGELNYKLAF
jgi:hypothetical protein